MKAAVFHGEKDIRIEQIKDPQPQNGEVLLRPRYCGICGSDLHAWVHGMYGQGVVLGHEFSAEVVDGTNTHWNPGDRVVANSIIPCKTCAYCHEGRYSLCDDMDMPGITMNGGLAELVVLPGDSLVPIPDSVGLKEAALTEPLSVVLHGFNLIDVKPGQTVLVLGAGPIGLLAAQVARLKGASFVAVSEPNSYRRTIAGKTAHVIDPHTTVVSLEFEKMTGEPADVVIECTGVASAASETFTLVKKGGTVLVLGLSDEPVDADFMTALLNELTFQFSYCGYEEFFTALPLIKNNTVDVSSLISNVISLDDVIEHGFKELMNPDSENVKILVSL